LLQEVQSDWAQQARRAFNEDETDNCIATAGGTDSIPVAPTNTTKGLTAMLCLFPPDPITSGFHQEGLIVIVAYTPSQNATDPGIAPGMTPFGNPDRRKIAIRHPAAPWRRGLTSHPGDA